MSKEKATPIKPSERIQSLDILRGFSILGIFLVNMASFHTPILYIDPKKWWEDDLDKWTNSFIDVFAQANFYTLFSFLFGYGMIMFIERAQSKRYSFYPAALRRLSFLFIIGCIHAFLIWHGDILMTYAFVGIILLLFHSMRPTILLVWSLFLLLVPSLLVTGLLYMAGLAAPDLSSEIPDQQLILQSMDTYSQGTFTEITLQRMADWGYVNNVENVPFLLLALLPMFLLGAFAAKVKWMEDSERHLKKLRAVWVLALCIGVPFKTLPYLIGDSLWTEYLQDYIGGPSIAILYATTIVLLTRYSFWKRVLTPLSFVGRLSLSNYLLQSILCTVLFYGYGLGLYGKVGLFKGSLLAIAIYLFQVLLSIYWVKYFQFGPIEWLWRTVTYRQKVTITHKK